MYNNLFRVTQEMAGCNGFEIKSIDKWGSIEPEFNISQLDEQASKLEGEELLIFVDGEESEVAELTSKLMLSELNKFLNEVFDGYLHEQISIPW
ncbi:hypothetical protein ACRTC3_16455 [Photobacterium damselae]|uniref:hypothetical protein n=1 Tax=Photobacterium damselae TaxID=38293 RepID=UPI003D7D2B96